MLRNNTIHSTLILANNIQVLGGKSGGISAPNITAADVRNINRLAQRRDIFDLLSRSVAPSIYGHEYIKKALLLLLLGGVERNLPNGTHIRGQVTI
jgi:DNA replication licensing factor MCM3